MEKYLVFVLAFLSCTINAKVSILKFEQCDPNVDYKVKYDIKLKEEGDGQVIESGNLISKVELGDNIQAVADAYSIEDGKEKFLLTIKETWCEAIKNYMGDFGYDMQEAAGIERGKCPIPPGDYKLEKYPLSFTKFKYKTVPDGHLKIKSNLYDVKTKELLGCMLIEAQIKKQQ